MKTPEWDLQGFTSIHTVPSSLVMETSIGLVGQVGKDFLNLLQFLFLNRRSLVVKGPCNAQNKVCVVKEKKKIN